ncbi:hypothetical protein WKW79_13225 [Variovorax robiniae]|uniref:DUF4239 domain-containing protein n=1 Tax=Variovorax robiniae TaxID=1836199 RepID=A0ABU8X6U3_9BURK
MMSSEFDLPLLLFVISVAILWLAGWFGSTVLRRNRRADGESQEDLGVILGATLALAGLIIGFTFSMAVSRYDQRKNFEEAEANAIGTEYVRADFLPAAEAARVRALLNAYLDQRVLFYTTRDRKELQQVNDRTAALQQELWDAVKTPALAQPNPIQALVVNGMNDVLNSQGYTQAAWWNRIPQAAWWLMLGIAICCNMLIGYGMRSSARRPLLLLVMPFVLSLAFLLIADIDTPRAGFVHVVPQNLLALKPSMKGP